MHSLKTDKVVAFLAVGRKSQPPVFLLQVEKKSSSSDVGGRLRERWDGSEMEKTDSENEKEKLDSKCSTRRAKAKEEKRDGREKSPRRLRKTGNVRRAPNAGPQKASLHTSTLPQRRYLLLRHALYFQTGTRHTPSYLPTHDCSSSQKMHPGPTLLPSFCNWAALIVAPHFP